MTVFKHSDSHFTVFFLVSILLFLIVLRPASTQAQMFSQDNRSLGATGIPGYAIYGGLEAVDFEYQGSSTVPSAGAGIFSFDGNVFRLMVDGPGLTFEMATGGDFTGLDDRSYFDGGIRAGYDIPIFRTGPVIATIPLQLQTSYTSVSNDDVIVAAATEFQQGTLGVGAGAALYARLASQVRFRANIIPSYGYSFSFRERNADGTLFGLVGGGRLYFDRLFGTAGLSLGYDYDLRDYDINDELLDYKSKAHRFLIGVTF